MKELDNSVGDQVTTNIGSRLILLQKASNIKVRLRKTSIPRQLTIRVCQVFFYKRILYT